MSLLAADAVPAPARTRTGRVTGRLAAAVLASRLIVLAGGLVAATMTRRASDWRFNDPQGLTLHLGAVGNALAGAAVRWDSIHYLTVAAHGYRTAPNTAFFPLYPLLIHLLGLGTGSTVIAGLLISAVCFAAWMALLHRLTRRELGARAADATVLLLAFSPLSLFFTAVYSESLFMALSIGAFVLARDGRWRWAGVAAAGATLTHVEGILLTAPLALMYLQSRTDPGARMWLRTLLRSPRTFPGDLRKLTLGATPLLLPVFALGSFLLYLHALGYGWLAPSSNERAYGHHFTGPVLGVIRGVGAGISGMLTILSGTPHGEVARAEAFLNVLYVAVLALALLTLWVAYRTLPKAYALYSGLCLLTFVSSPVSGAPLTSLDRYVLVLFPLWMVAARWLEDRRRLPMALIGCGMLLFVFALQFARWSFVG